MALYLGEPSRSPRMCYHQFWQILHEDPALALSVATPESPGCQHNEHSTALLGKIIELAVVMAVDAMRRVLADRTTTGFHQQPQAAVTRIEFPRLLVSWLVDKDLDKAQASGAKVIYVFGCDFVTSAFSWNQTCFMAVG